MLTIEAIREAEARSNELHQLIQVTFAERGRSEECRRKWEVACKEFHRFEHGVLRLWEPSVQLEIELAPGQWRDAAILFLEADPWFFRSGYLKARLLRVLKRATLSSREADRLLQVVLNSVDKRHREEFRSYVQLAARIATPQLREQLRDRLSSPDAEIRRRAGWMLDQVAGRIRED